MNDLVQPQSLSVPDGERLPVLVIAGFGAGLGDALAARFLAAGYAVVALSRSGTVGVDPSVRHMAVDLTDAAAVAQTFERIEAEVGAPTVLVHTAAELVRGPFLSQSPADFERAWRIGVLTAVVVSQQAIPRMLAAQRGTLLFAGATASLRGAARFAPFAAAKAALRALAGSLAREFQGQGIHVAHVVLDGILWSAQSQQRFPGLQAERCLQPADVADVFLQLAHQAPSAWTHELDLRPASETF